MESEEFPTDLNDSLTLPNRKRLRIRALGQCEEATLRELFARLSPRTRYLRFLSPFSTVPESVVRLLASVDYRRHLALVAEHHNGNDVEVVGLGSFGAIDDHNAEVALVVRDDWQRQHVGTELATRILQAAENRGFHQFSVHVLSDNVAIRKLLERVGEVVSSKSSGTVSELVFVRRQRT
jgi:RimJ/RimL family protein N-acetyltransferase